MSAWHGIGTWPGPGVDDALADCRPDWCYTWRPSPDGLLIPSGVEFVPMIRDLDQLTPDGLATAAAHSDTVLGFNEPDRADQAALDVRTALDAWTMIAPTGLRLGSPAVAANAELPGGWLDQFMTGAVRLGAPPDFIACHWYGWRGTVEATVEALAASLHAVHRRYQLPIWLTEFAAMPSVGINFVAEEQAPQHDLQGRFLRAAVDRLSGLDFVERYAWFSLTPAPGLGPTALYRPDGKISAVGSAFRELRGR